MNDPRAQEFRELVAEASAFRLENIRIVCGAEFRQLRISTGSYAIAYVDYPGAEPTRLEEFEFPS